VPTTTPNKVQMTVSVDQETRTLFAKHGGQRSIGRLLSTLIRQYDVEERYGTETVRTRLDRIEDHLRYLREEREERNRAL
jgi:hypothetical protein